MFGLVHAGACFILRNVFLLLNLNVGHYFLLFGKKLNSVSASVFIPGRTTLFLQLSAQCRGPSCIKQLKIG